MASCQSTGTSRTTSGTHGSIPTHTYTNAKTVKDIRELQPQSTLPLKVAVIPSDRRHGISFEEIKIIDKWNKKLKQSGFIQSLEVVPTSLLPKCGYKADSDCFLNQARTAGARLGADAILFLNESSETQKYVNPLSILNLTIVGMWFVPAHHRDSNSRYEGSLIDIDNGYIYSAAEGRGENQSIRPYMYTNNSGLEKAKLEALDELGQKLFDVAQEYMTSKNSPNKKINKD
mgnify:CR=1 FL=1